jgi:phasin family protein
MLNDMENLFIQTWKAQLDLGLHVLETIAEGAIRMREAQLEAATQAHADLEATRKSIAAASDAAQILKLQAEWAAANAEKSLAYWRCLCQAVVETDTEVAKCVGTPAAAPQGFNLGMIDSAYKQWLEGVQRLYQVRA